MWQLSMVLNQGDNRNHAHLHLKVKVHEREFERAAAGWTGASAQRLVAIRAFRDTLPLEHRGTHAAYMLRVQQAGGGRGGGGRGGRGERGGRGGGRSGGSWRQQQRNDAAPQVGVAQPAAGDGDRAPKRQHIVEADA